jgi:hypothetical protein
MALQISATNESVSSFISTIILALSNEGKGFLSYEYRIGIMKSKSNLVFLYLERNIIGFGKSNK